MEHETSQKLKISKLIFRNSAINMNTKTDNRIYSQERTPKKK